MILALEAPDGAVLEFALLFLVILLGPVVVERARVPGIIGLLLGGFTIGPHGLGWIEAGNDTIPELGQLGLLYLMFVAGLELDLRLLGEYRRAAVTFGVLTFLLPFVGGVAVGFQQGWEAPAALLLGSLLASHTLILYPTVRDAGRGGLPAVATAVGATVLTDTLALVVLAGVAGTSTGSGSTAGVLAEVGLGLVVLAVVGLGVLPRVALGALRLWGGDRAARYLVSLVAFLLMAMLAEVFGIEGIVGAFVAGLALNRLVPNTGPSMELIEFFGSAVLVPVFLVSVGLLLDPSVMFTTETLGIAGLLCLACIGGKAAAAALARPLLGFTSADAGLMFALTTPQAAATLAATLVGYDIGLFGTAVVNAVLVLILVSIVVSTLAAHRFTASAPIPPPRPGTLGRRVLLASPLGGPTPVARWIAEQLVTADDGTVDVVLVHRTEDGSPDETATSAIERTLLRGRLDGTVRPVVDDDAGAALVAAVRGTGASALLVDATAAPWPANWRLTLDLLGDLPTMILTGPGDGPAIVAVEVAHDAGPEVTAVARSLRPSRHPGAAGTRLQVVAVPDWAAPTPPDEERGARLLVATRAPATEAPGEDDPSS